MKEIKLFISIFVIILLLPACSNSGSYLELKSAKVDLRNDEERLGATGITSGDRKGEFIVPIALSYDFVIKNTGNKKIGTAEKINDDTFSYDDGIIVRIKPNKKLKQMSEDIMGFNIYDENEYLGLGETSFPVLESNQEGTYTFDFELGALEENPDLKFAPPMEQLEKLKANAMDATLIVTIGDEEITRFDLSDLD